MTSAHVLNLLKLMSDAEFALCDHMLPYLMSIRHLMTATSH